jgi:hypothetical protein
MVSYFAGTTKWPVWAVSGWCGAGMAVIVVMTDA